MKNFEFLHQRQTRKKIYYSALTIFQKYGQDLIACYLFNKRQLVQHLAIVAKIIVYSYSQNFDPACTLLRAPLFILLRSTRHCDYVFKFDAGNQTQREFLVLLCLNIFFLTL